MGAAAKPPWVRALCLRSTASQALERPAASDWAGPRSGVYGVSRNRTHPAIPDSPLSLLLLLRPLPLPLRVQGAALQPPFPEHSAQWFERRAHAGHGTLGTTEPPVIHREPP